MPNKKINIVLDLDNTLLNSLSFDELSLLPKGLKAEKKIGGFSSSSTQHLKYIDMDRSYRVFIRPYLDKFLDFLFANFNVSVWTAASKEYASFIIDKLILQGKKDRKLDYILFSYHCKKSKKHLRCTKDLAMLWEELKLHGYNENNTYIIDDLQEIYETIPDNVYPAKYFDVLEGGAEKDRYLLDMITTLKKLLV